MKERAYEIARNSKKPFASIAYKYFDQKTGSEASVSEELAQELHRSLIKNSKEGRCMRGLKIIFGHQI